MLANLLVGRKAKWTAIHIDRSPTDGLGNGTSPTLHLAEAGRLEVVLAQLFFGTLP